MPPADTASRFAVQRYRTRLLVARLSMGRPSTFDLVNLGLAIVGAWSVIYQVLKLLLPGPVTTTGLTVTGVAAVVVILVLVWFRVTRRPQDIFRSAARSEERAEVLRKAMVEGMARDFAYENLARLYAPFVPQVAAQLPDARVTWPTDTTGRHCLVLTIAPTTAQGLDRVIQDIEAAQSIEWTDRASRFAPERQAFMATMRRSVSLANMFGDEAGSNIVVTGITATPELTMSVNTATYGQIVRTCDSLVNEFAVYAHLASRSAFRRRPKPLRFDPDGLLKVLPWRRQVHSWDEGEALLLAPRGRASGVGVSLSLVDVRDGRPAAFVARRSSNVGTYPDVLHVVPSGMMNAHSDVRHSARERAALPRLAMLVEFLEECFNVAELSGHADGNFAKRVQQKLDEYGLTGLEPAFTGFALDLLNLRTDVCGVLDLSAYQSAVDAFNLSWEYTHTERLQRIDLDTPTLAVRRTDYVQSGIGSLLLASSWLAERASQTPERADSAPERL